MAVEYLDEDPKGVEFLDETIATVGTASPATDRGGVGVPLPLAEAQDIAAQRLVARGRAAGQTDLLTRDEANQLAEKAGIPGLPEGVHVVSLNDVGSPFIREILKVKEFAGAAGFGLGPAIQKLIEDATMNPELKSILGQTALRERTPEITAGSQLAGSIIPLAGGANLVSQVPTLGQRIGRSILIGGGVGAAYGGSGTVAEKGTEVTLPEVATGVGTGAAVGAGLGSVIGGALAVPAAAKVMASRGVLKAPLEDVVTKTLGITAQEGSMDLVPVVKSRILEATGKAPTTASEAIAAAAKTEDFLINKTVDALKLADQQGLQMSKAQMLQNAENAIRKAQPTIPQAEVDAALKPFRDRLPDTITPSQGQKLLVEQNNFLDSVFGDTGVPARKTKGNASVTARLGIADSLSNQLDDLYKAASGLDESPYRDWGQIRDAKQGLNDQIIAAQRSQAGATPGGRGIPVTKTGAAHKILKKAARPFVAREIEFIDDGVKRIFRDAPSTPDIQPINPTIQQGLILKYTPVAPLAPVAPAAPAAIPPATLQAIISQSLAKTGGAPVSANLEAAIAAKIKTYPRKLRDDKALARIAAKTELGID